MLLFQGNLVSQLGTQAFSIAMLFLIKHETGSATLMGTLLMASMLPSVLAGPFGGTFADYHSRKQIIVISDLINGVVVTAFAVYYFLFPVVDTLFLVLLFAVSVVVSTVRAFFTPAVLAALPDLVEEKQLTGANSMIQGSTQLSMLVGQGIGGLLYRLVGPAWLFLIDGLSYLLSMVSEFFIDLPRKDRSDEGSTVKNRFRTETVDGFRYIWRKPGMRMVFLAAGTLNFFFAPIMVIMPFYVEDYMHLPTDWYGYIYAFFGLGTIIGFGLASALKVQGRAASVLVGLSFIVFGGIMTGLAFTQQLWAVIALTIIGGAAMGIVNINIMTQLQSQTEERYRGRVMGNLTTLSMGIMPISLGLTGLVLDLLNQDVLLLLSITGAIVIVIAFFLMLNAPFMQFFAVVTESKETNADSDEEQGKSTTLQAKAEALLQD